MRQDNFTQVLIFLNELNMPVTNQVLKTNYKSISDYDSFLGMSDLLNTCLVPNAAYQFTFDDLLKAELEDQFSIHIR